MSRRCLLFFIRFSFVLHFLFDSFISIIHFKNLCSVLRSAWRKCLVWGKNNRRIFACSHLKCVFFFFFSFCFEHLTDTVSSSLLQNKWKRHEASQEHFVTLENWALFMHSYSSCCDSVIPHTQKEQRWIPWKKKTNWVSTRYYERKKKSEQKLNSFFLLLPFTCFGRSMLFFLCKWNLRRSNSFLFA